MEHRPLQRIQMYTLTRYVFALNFIKIRKLEKCANPALSIILFLSLI